MIHQYKVALGDISPTIWRRIQVPEKYSFWDLHVAIQDSIGWLDYHLHAYRFPETDGSAPWRLDYLTRRPLIQSCQVGKFGSATTYLSPLNNSFIHRSAL